MQDCVVNRIKALFPDCIDQPAVHRLDMDTSGLMVVARASAAHRHFSLQFAERLVNKRYIALLEGILGRQSGEITLPFRLDPDNRPRQIHDPLHGKMGISRWRLIGIEGQRSRVEFTPLTGDPSTAPARRSSSGLRHPHRRRPTLWPGTAPRRDAAPFIWESAPSF